MSYMLACYLLLQFEGQKLISKDTYKLYSAQRKGTIGPGIWAKVSDLSYLVAKNQDILQTRAISVRIQFTDEFFPFKFFDHALQATRINFYVEMLSYGILQVSCIPEKKLVIMHLNADAIADLRKKYKLEDIVNDRLDLFIDNVLCIEQTLGQHVKSLCGKRNIISMQLLESYQQELFAFYTEERTCGESFRRIDEDQHVRDSFGEFVLKQKKAHDAQQPRGSKLVGELEQVCNLNFIKIRQLEDQIQVCTRLVENLKKEVKQWKKENLNQIFYYDFEDEKYTVGRKLAFDGFTDHEHNYYGKAEIMADGLRSEHKRLQHMLQTNAKFEKELDYEISEKYYDWDEFDTQVYIEVKKSEAQQKHDYYSAEKIEAQRQEIIIAQQDFDEAFEKLVLSRRKNRPEWIKSQKEDINNIIQTQIISAQTQIMYYKNQNNKAILINKNGDKAIKQRKSNKKTALCPKFKILKKQQNQQDEEQDEQGEQNDGQNDNLFELLKQDFKDLSIPATDNNNQQSTKFNPDELKFEFKFLDI